MDMVEDQFSLFRRTYRLETTESEVWGILCKEVMGGNIKF